MVFWRLLNLELWLRIFFDEKENHQENVKSVWKFGQANSGKKIEITVAEKNIIAIQLKRIYLKEEMTMLKK
jgi:hypothetical protein